MDKGEKEIKEKLFELYFTTKGYNEWTALYLNMCKNIVQDSYGKVSLENREYTYNGVIFKGTEFTISFSINAHYWNN